MHYESMIRGSAAGICIVALLASGVRAVDVEVGPGRTHATISAAIAAANAGDRILVYSGLYTEQIAWGKAVDIVEAPGQTAVLVASDSIAGDAPLFLIDIGLSDAVSVNWDGIDVHNDSTKFSRFFMERSGNADAVVTVKNVSVTDTPIAEGHGRVFSAETGTLNIENVVVNMGSTAGDTPGYEIAVAAVGENVTVNATNSVFATSGGTVVHSGSATARMVFNSSTLNRKPGPSGFLTDISDGSLTFNDCYLTAGDSTFRGVLLRFGMAKTPIEFNRCRWNPNVNWYAIAIEKAVEMTLTNCSIPTSNDFAMLHNNGTMGGGDTSDITITHTTFSSTSSGPARSGIRDETVVGATVNYVVDNCIFNIPGSTNGAIHNNTQGGTVTVTATDNLVYNESDTPAPGLLTGNVLTGDPKISTFDFCHIVDALSAAIDAASSLGIANDIDKETRDGSPDFGADEYSATIAAPSVPINVTATPGNGTVRVSWNPPVTGGPIAGYDIYRVSPAPTTKLNSALYTGLDFSATGLQNGQEHCFTVRSIGATGAESADSVQACATPAGGSGVNNLEVGPGRTFETIQAAIDAARPGGVDRIVVYTGEYDEKLQIKKQVDIVEAEGEEAVLHLTDNAGNGFAIEYIDLGEYSVNWDGIDVLYEGTGFSRIFLVRFNNSGTIVNVKNMNFQDIAGAGGQNTRLFTVEVAGTLNLENVTVDLASECPGCYGIVLGAMTGGVHATAKNCVFRGPIGDKILSAEGGNNTRMTIDSCEFDNKGLSTGAGFIADLAQGVVTINDSTFTGTNATRGIVCRGFGRLTLTLNRCKFDPNAPWQAVSFEKAVTAAFTNCCFARNPDAGGVPFSILHTNTSGTGSSTVGLKHCTFASTAENAGNTGLKVETAEGRTMELTVENCIFDIPGSTVGAIEDNSQGGTTDVIAGKNARWLGNSPGLSKPDLLEADPAGTIVDGDPGLDTDLCHLSPPSSALNAGDPIGVTDDIDGETRPGVGVDLGADEFSGTPAPSCPIENVVCNTSDGLEVTWEIASEGGDNCRCARIEVRNAVSGAVILTLAGNVTSDKIPCAALPDSGSLAVVCVGPDGTEKQATCQFTCGSSTIPFHRGDADANGNYNITDPVRTLNYLFLGADAPPCLDAADTDDNGDLNITDPVRSLNYLFLGGPPPAPPGPIPEPCGPDAGAELGCVEYSGC